MKINFKSLKPKSGKAESIVFFMHGYGANGQDLLGIGEFFSESLPNTMFIAPDAPWKCAMSPVGYQWFPIPWIDGSSEQEANEKLEIASKEIDRWIDEILANESLDSRNAFLFGFSQGTMLSLHIGPRRFRSLGGIIGCSGKILDVNFLRSSVNSKPPILLMHGDQDDVVDFSFLREAVTELESLKFNVKKHVSRGVGHGISPDGIKVALDFLIDLIKRT